MGDPNNNRNNNMVAHTRKKEKEKTDEVNNMEINEELAFNLLCDLKKKEVNPIDRANFIKEYLEKKGLSQRALAKELGIPHSTIQDWVCYANITKPEYNNLLEIKGYNKKQIYHLVRDNRTETKTKILKAQKEVHLNNTLRDYNNNLRFWVNHVEETNNETLDLIRDLKNTLNRIQLHIERGNK